MNTDEGEYRYPVRRRCSTHGYAVVGNPAEAPRG